MAQARKRQGAGTRDVRAQLRAIARAYPELVRAYGHPLRTQIIELFDDDERRALSPSEIAEELDRPLGVVSYHIRVLAELGVVSCVRTSKVRGATRHDYRLA